MRLILVLILYKLKIRITFTTFLLIVAFGINLNASSSTEELCDFQKSIFLNANNLYQRGQYLLGAGQYLMLFSSECKNLASKSRYNYSLAMLELGEGSELLEQYRYFKLNNARESDLIKEVIDFSTGNLNNPKVNVWMNLGNDNLSLKYLKNNRDALKAYEEYRKKINTKSPLLSGTLSALLPGAGQVYNGSYQSAAISFILNTIFLYSTIEFADKNLSAPAIASGVVFSVTYVGNVMNAVRGSNAINNRLARPSKNEIKKFLFPVLTLRF